ncbi:hypothetical protein D9619_000046 [Psilocybe cf. subviscida]|uniref:Uncharacterized protein n=1 Tax=Psilocybe cf. subviscida TaxID=2480587 RepID=A0A8H5BGJ3_9AGAR|nr:hypothetical protein D9619_000046 [Psilocybe cf. subviscida]
MVDAFLKFATLSMYICIAKKISTGPYAACSSARSFSAAFKPFASSFVDTAFLVIAGIRTTHFCGVQPVLQAFFDARSRSRLDHIRDYLPPAS